jgi:hypothetical protein
MTPLESDVACVFSDSNRVLIPSLPKDQDHAPSLNVDPP